MSAGGDQRVGLTLEANLDPSGVLTGVKSIQNGLNGLKIDPKLMSGLTKEIEKVNTLVTKYQSQLAKGVSTKTDAKNLAKTGSEIQESLNNIVKGIREVNESSITLKVEDANQLKTLEDNLKNIKKQIQDTFQQNLNNSGLTAALDKFAAGTGRAKTVQNLVNKAEIALERQELEKFGNTLDEIKGKLGSYKGTTLVSIGKALGLEGLSSNDTEGAINKINSRIEELKTKANAAGDAIEGLKEKETAAAKAVDDFKPGAIERSQKATGELVATAEQVPSTFNQIKQSADGMASSILDAKTQVDQLKQSTQYFFSLRNMINLLKRGIREAVDVVKELDAAMTETAVVTNYSVSDMWAKLPEYTANANALGASVRDMYEATTLYYQQGLNTEQAMGIANETMKMARIGGLEAADATDKMTAALRGFNMEISETSAQRVNDVYSNLAAKTASNTEELGTAMQRTASIAASAGMSFEGTAAFLAQAIETTREPAENLGTAMKTIVARFTELKKNPLEITEVDGEEVSYNKVDTALQSIGVSLKDANGQFRDLDQVFLDISQRWDSLSQTQQRYIATIAAGSRQQSRFIAMMSNYDRTVQLMDYANNSAGASNEQFGKTMESLEAKLNKLKNAWQQFEMGIANNSFIKTAVDGLTGFLNITNKVIDKLSLGSGAIKSFLSVFAAFTGLKATGRLANQLIGGLGGLVDPTSTFKQGFRGGAIKQGQTGTAQAKAISDPIVLAVNRIYGAITGKQATTNQTAQNTIADFKSFKEANANMRDFLGGIKANQKFSITEAYKKISNLDERQQKAVLQQLPGLQLSLQKGIEFDTTGINEESKQLVQSFVSETNKGLKEKAIDSQGVLQLFGTPDNFKRAMEVRGPEYAKAASEVLFNQKAYDEAYKQTYQNLLSSDDMSYLSEEQLHQAAHREAQAAAEAKALEEYNKRIKGTGSAGMQAANDIASVGQAAVTAGQGVAQLGMQLSNAGFTQAGQAVTNLGYQISSLGQIATSVGSVVGKISGAGGIGALAAAHPVITALIAAVTLLGGAFAIASAHFKNIKKAGEEVTNTFKETSKSAEDNITKLKAYQSEFAQLSKGVDANGNNVNLDDSQYQRYLEIVDDIAEINPDIVKGYNAQGHAIIDNNEALAETLKTQQSIRDEAYKTYTDEKSLQKLINARNINKGYKNIKITGQEVGTYYGYGHGAEGRLTSNGIGNAIPLAGDVSSIVDKLRLLQGTDAFGNAIKVNDEMLQKYGIESLNALITGEEQAVKNFVKHRQQIEADLTNSGFKLSDSITKGFETLDKDADAFDEAIQPVYDNLLTNVSNSKVFESIAPEFREALNMGLKDLASQDLDAPEMAKAANNMAARFANLTNGSGKYKDALDIAEKAQNDFASSLNETRYTADVQPAIDDLIRLKEEALSEGSAYGDALAEYLGNQIQRISNFTTEGGANLTEALNTATDEIAAAEGALDSFNEATKKDFSTAAESMKGIFDKTTETFKDSYDTEIQKHAEGMGDATFWTGAEALLSEKEINRLTKGKNGYEAAEAVKKRLEGLEPMLREGQEGFDAFTDRVLENADAMDKLAKAGVEYDKESGLITNIPDDQWHNVAEALGISDDLLTSMLNKGRQFADISFMNVEDARKALAASDYTIKGTNAAPGEQQNLYVKEGTLRQQLADAGYVRKEQQDEQIAKLQKEQNVKTLKAAEEYKKGSKELAKSFTDMGVKTLPDLIQTLVDTGDFNKEEIQAYADKLGLLGDEGRFDSLYDSIIEASENPELVRQTNILETISAQVAALRDDRTGTEAKSEYDKFHDELYGGDGHDTGAQLFGDGLNKEGKQLSAGEYEQTKKDLEESAQAAREQAAIAKERAKTETGLEKERWENIAKYYEQDADYIDKLLDRGAEAFEKNQERIDKELEARESKKKGRKKEQEAAEQIEKRGKKKAQQSYNERGFGNADDIDRGVIRWGTDPTKNSNYKAAQTWGWNSKDLANSASTYMSTGMTFGQGENAVELTVTPILQTPDGTPQVLGKDTVNKYFDEIVRQATNSSGKIDTQKLFELDKEGLEVEGQEINNLLMGAFTGTGARQAADALGKIEHQLEVDKTKAQELNKATKQIGRQENRTQQATPKKSETPSPASISQAIDSAQERGITQTIHYQAVVDDNVEDLNKKYGYDRTTKRVIEYLTKGEEDFQLAEDEISNIDLSLQDPKQVVIEANTSGVTIAQAALNTLPKSRNVKVTATDNTGGVLSSIASKLSSLASKAKNLFLGGGGAVGINNTIHTSSIPTFQSAAKGMVGPKNKGGLTLTGEKGFEIAWLPSESRSMILGAGGPQMINLPSDAVVYTHEQSKQILKRKGIPAGSHADESASSSSYKKKYTSTTSASTTTSYTTAVVNAAKKAGDKVSKTAEDTSKAIARVTVWWENAARRAESIQRRIDKNQDKYEDYLKKAYITLTQTSKKGGGNAFIANNISYTKEQQRQYNKASQELKQLYSGRWQAGKYKGKKASGKTAYLRGADNVIEVSYGKDKKVYDDTAKYIKYDKKSGSYQVDQKAINRIKNRERRKATAEQVNKELNDRISKRNTALDNIKKAKEALDKFSQELYDTFFGWEISLTRIWNITQKIEAAQARISSLDAGNSLLNAQLSSGSRKGNNDTAQFDLSLFQTKLEQQNQVLQLRQDAITQAQQDVQNAIKTTDEQQILKKIKKKLKKGNLSEATRLAYEEYVEQLQDSIKITQKAQKYLTTTQNADGTVGINFNANQLEKDRLKGKITADEAKAIEEYKNSIEEANNNLNEQRQSLIDGVTDYYNTLADLKDQWADYESQLIQINEESNKKELENLKKLSDTVKKSLDDLLDSVKKQLEERRKQEDNSKTERSISQKQQRLAMLRADTSGGHQVEIAQLEKEIVDAQTDYQRSLEDQLLEKLRNQADEAAKQRERQIELQEELASSVNNIALVDMWMSNPEEYREEILQAYRTANDYDKTGIYGQQKIDRQFESFYEGLLTNQTKQNNVSKAIEDASAALKTIEDYLKRIDISIDNAKSKGISVKEAHDDYFEGTSYKNLAKNGNYTIDDFAKDKISYQTARSVFSAEELQKNSYYKAQAKAEIEENRQKTAVQKRESKLSNAQEKVATVQKQLSSAKDSTEKRYFAQLYTLANKNLTSVKYQNFLEARGSKQNSGDKNWGKLGKDGYIAQVERGKALGYSEKKVATDLANTDKLTWQQVIKAAYQAGRSGTTIKNWYPNAKETGNFRKAFDKVFTKGWAKYAQGGLADFTGPAWLDGTPSKPELVLNANDTKNFLALRDVLDKAIGSANSVTNSYGGNATYEININVDKIEKDYDVDRVAERVKKIIVKDSGYRNVTQVRNFR